jgi:hypothetical protein
MEVPSDLPWRNYEPGPVIRHLPCGHQWFVWGGGWLPDDIAPEAFGR